MCNIYVVIGEDLIRKNKFIESCIGNTDEYNSKKIILDNGKVSSVDSIYEDSFMFLNTFDMFDNRKKLLRVYLDNEKQAVRFIEKIVNYVEGSIIVIDVLKNNGSELNKSGVYKENKKNIFVKKYDKLKEKDRKEVVSEMMGIIKENDISFKDSNIEKFCLDYIFDNSNYSYSIIYKYIEQLLLMDKKVLSCKDVEEFVSISFNGNYYVIVDRFWKSESILDCIVYLDKSFNVFNKSDYIVFINIFIKILNDYMRFESGLKCNNGSNYYKFKNSKIKIKDLSNFYVDLEEFFVEIRENDYNLKENLLNIFMKYIS